MTISMRAEYPMRVECVAGRGGRSGGRTAFRRTGGFSVVRDDDCGKMARPELCGNALRSSARVAGEDAERGLSSEMVDRVRDCEDLGPRDGRLDSHGCEDWIV